jgi:hypothetical protein
VKFIKRMIVSTIYIHSWYSAIKRSIRVKKQRKAIEAAETVADQLKADPNRFQRYSHKSSESDER